MKILLLTDKMDVGGAETHILTLATALKSLGHSVTLVSSGGALARALIRTGIPHLTLPLHRKDPFSILRSFFSLRSLMVRERFDVVHSHARLPSLLAAHLTSRLDLPLITTAHARFSLSPLLRHLSRWGDRTIAVGEDLKQYLIESYGLPPENITVIPNGIDVNRFLPSDEPSRQPPRIAFLSRLDRDCSLGARLLCTVAPELCRRFGRIEISIGGGGSCLSDITELAALTNAAVGFDCVRVAGHIANVPEFLRRANIFVGVSRAAAEAALCALPVILCGNEGFFGRLTAKSLPEALAGNFCARGYPPPTARALLDSLSSLMGEAPSVTADDTAKLRRLLLLRVDPRITAKATADIYRSATRPTKGYPQVLLCGYYGFGNMGDDALLRSAIARARRELPDLKIGALTRYPHKDSACFGINCIDRSSPLLTLPALMRCEYFILGGGTLLQARTSRRSLLYYAGLLRLAHAFGAKCLLWGNGIGELTRPWERKLVASVLDKCEYIGLRDSASLTLATSLTDKPAFLEEDLAEGSVPCSAERSAFLLRRLFGSSDLPPFIIAAPKRGVGLDGLLCAIRNASRRGLATVFVAMHEGEDTGLCIRLVKGYGGKLLSGISYSDLIGVISHDRCQGAYSMRLHALIAARSAGKPYKAYGNDGKLKML